MLRVIGEQQTRGGEMDGRRLRNIATVARAMTIVAALAVGVAIAAPGAGAHDDGTTSHLWLDHIKPMKQPGTINDSTNPVDWTKLKNVPAGLADGIDNGVSKAGFGLGIGRGPFFYVDTSEIQQRINSFCATGQAIKSVGSNGSVSCTAGPRGLTLRIADTGLMCNSACTEGTLVLSPGTWAINAKIRVRQEVFDHDHLKATCTLEAGGLVDKATVDLDTGGLSIATLPMQLIATLSSNVHASVNCGDGDEGEARGFDLAIQAIRLSN